MNVAYCILCHRMTNPLRYTVNYLSKFSCNKIFIHVDLKCNIKPFIEEFVEDNVFFVSDRVNVAWGSVTQVDATLSLLRAAVKEKFDYVFLISGDDIPAVTNSDIVEFLTRFKGYEFIAYQDDRFSYVDPRERVKYCYPEYFFKKERSALEKVKVRVHRAGCRLGLSKNKMYEDLPKLYKGTQWFTITDSCARFILDYVRDKPAYRHAFKNSLCSDEIFFHSIIAQSEFKNAVYHDGRLYSDNLRYIDWKSGPDYPRTLDETDFDRIIRSGMLFARKLKPDIDLDSLCFFNDKPTNSAMEIFIPEEVG
jgi:hypothetical protein